MPNTEFTIEPGRQEIVIQHTFDAPKDVVFEALTDPKRIAQWWGPAQYEVVVDEADVRPGGRWRFLSRDSNGENETAFRGVFHTVNAPDLLVQTFEFEGFPGHVSLETTNLTEVDGKTKYTVVSVFQSVADRDGMVQSGMEGGARETYERLDALLKQI